LSQSVLNRAPPRSSLARPAAAAPASSWKNAYLLGVWILLAILTPLVGFLGARGFAPAVGFAGLLCLPFVRPRNPDLAGLILFALLVEWTLISALWSPAPLPHTWHDIGRFTGLHIAQQVLFCGALIITARTLPPRTARTALAWVGAGLMVLAGVLLFESLTDALLLQTVQRLGGQKPSPVTHWALRSVAQGGYALAALFWPTAIALKASGRPRLLLAFIALCLLDFVLLHISALAVAILVSAVVFALVYWRGRIAALACMAVAALQTLLTPWLLLALTQGGLFQDVRAHLPPSWAARTKIWGFASTHMLQKPVFGWGLDSSRTFGDNIPLHPHDAALQLWFELGIPGAILGALIWGFVFWQFAKAAPERRLYAAAGCAVGTVCLTIGAVSFGLWQEWWICLMALGFAACVALGQQLDGQKLDGKAEAVRG
jgi:O-antigen ligase